MFNPPADRGSAHYGMDSARGLTAPPSDHQLHSQRAYTRCTMTIGQRNSILNAKTVVRQSAIIIQMRITYPNSKNEK